MSTTSYDADEAYLPAAGVLLRDVSDDDLITAAQRGDQNALPCPP
jgi:hypothetical protein